MGDPSFLNGYRIMNMKCFPFLQLIRRSTDFPCHQFGPLGLVFLPWAQAFGGPGHCYGSGS